MSDGDHAPTQSALYHLALALIRSGSVEPVELIEAAQRIERDGRDDPDNEAWEDFAHALRIAALDVDDEVNRPKFGVIDGGKSGEE